MAKTVVSGAAPDATAVPVPNNGSWSRAEYDKWPGFGFGFGFVFGFGFGFDSDSDSDSDSCSYSLVDRDTERRKEMPRQIIGERIAGGRRFIHQLDQTRIGDRHLRRITRKIR